jgi:uncharacterized protein (DUF1684 family)
MVFSKVFSQNSYKDSLSKFIKDYISNHEVVTGEDRRHLHFYNIDEKFKIIAKFEKINNAPWFKMESTGLVKRMYRVYGKVHFKIEDSAITLSIYQSQDLMQMDKYRDHLFIPFTDATSGVESYEGGRYFDLTINDIKDSTLVIDFNKAYNPYCAYVSNVYNCPIPPRENRLTVAIRAGEKVYGKAH